MRTFSSAREIFKGYFPRQFENERIEKIGFYEQIQYESDKLVKELLRDFRLVTES